MFRIAWGLYAAGLLFSGLHIIGDSAAWLHRFPNVSVRLFVGEMLFILAVFSNIPFLVSFRALRVAEVLRSWKVLIVASLIANASLLLFIPRYALEPGYPFWLLAFAALAWAFIGTTDDRTPSVTKNRYGKVIEPNGLEGVPFLVWAWLGFTIFWIGVTTATYVHRDRRPEDTPALTSYVTDASHLLDDNARAEVVQMLAAFEKESSTQIALAIYPHAPTSSIDNFTIRTAERSRLGTSAHDNGAILFLFAKERVARLEVGYGLEGALPDGSVQIILSRKLAPLFARGEYSQGVSDTLLAIISSVRSEYHGHAPRGDVEEGTDRVRIAWRRVRREGWTFAETAPLEGRLSVGFFGSLFALVFREALVSTARLCQALFRGVRNLMQGRPLRSGIPPLEFASIFNALKVLVFFVAILQGVALAAGGGAFGGGGAAVRW